MESLASGFRVLGLARCGLAGSWVSTLEKPSKYIILYIYIYTHTKSRKCKKDVHIYIYMYLHVYLYTQVTHGLTSDESFTSELRMHSRRPGCPTLQEKQEVRSLP